MSQNPANRRRSSLFGREILEETTVDQGKTRYPPTLYEELKALKAKYVEDFAETMKEKSNHFKTNPRKPMDFSQLPQDKQDFINSLPDLDNYINTAKRFIITCNNLKNKMEDEEREKLKDIF